MRKYLLASGLLVAVAAVNAQIPVEGITWERYEPKKKIHLSNQIEKHMMWEWSPFQELSTSVGKNASYTYDAANETETFQLYGKNANRAEVRLINEYEFGARQFEGYVTIYEPLNDECLMQVWGSAKGATQMMFRGFQKDGGHFTVNCGEKGRVKLMENIYGKEVKVNIIHLQEDVGNKFFVYLNNEKVFESEDNEKAVNNFNGNYHKYGVYGTVKDGHESPKVVWRKVRHYKDQGGKMWIKADQKITFPEFTPKKVGDADFQLSASLDSKLPLRYRSSDPKVATVSDDGKVHLVSPGKVLVLAFHEGNDKYHPTNMLRELVVEK
jgi:hypothetical protein